MSDESEAEKLARDLRAAFRTGVIRVVAHDGRLARIGDVRVSSDGGRLLVVLAPGYAASDRTTPPQVATLEVSRRRGGPPPPWAVGAGPGTPTEGS